VVLFHLHDFFPNTWRPAGAYLAVDLFFALSGFVLAEAYSARLDAGLPFVDFMGRRLLRLWPLYALGLLIGATPTALKVATHQAPLSALAPALAGLVYCPWVGPHGELYPFNIPAWSLLFELIANVVMAAAWRWLSQGALIAIVAVSGLGLVASAVVFGSLDAGFAVATAPAGLARVGFSFFLGLLIWRARPAPLRLSAWAPVLALAAALAVGAGPLPRSVVDLALVFAVFPLIVWLGAATQPAGASLSAFKVAGAASYALYAVHVPLLWLATGVFEKALHGRRAAAPAWLGLVVLPGLVALAWGLNAADVGLRRRLEGLLGRRARVKASTRESLP
jgi:peptidoglycan/LPS O-acetylase OafA/YrhL